MAENVSGKVQANEKTLEQEALNYYNDGMKGKVIPQNHEHNARKEGFARKEQHRNN